MKELIRHRRANGDFGFHKVEVMDLAKLIQPAQEVGKKRSRTPSDTITLPAEEFWAHLDSILAPPYIQFGVTQKFLRKLFNHAAVNVMLADMILRKTVPSLEELLRTPREPCKPRTTVQVRRVGGGGRYVLLFFFGGGGRYYNDR